MKQTFSFQIIFVPYIHNIFGIIYISVLNLFVHFGISKFKTPTNPESNSFTTDSKTQS